MLCLCGACVLPFNRQTVYLLPITEKVLFLYVTVFTDWIFNISKAVLTPYCVLCYLSEKKNKQTKNTNTTKKNNKKKYLEMWE